MFNAAYTALDGDIGPGECNILLRHAAAFGVIDDVDGVLKWSSLVLSLVPMS